MVARNISAEGELVLCIDGLTCPDQYVNDFTPLEFEEIVDLFQEYDRDSSGEINVSPWFRSPDRPSVDRPSS